ncbi:MAG: sigma-54-dependent Fis family transcriptional regulator [Gammaproteobacteria bacterium]|nr:MAG: sigma-54-dependent Fis family transcriptional regulator [Gammaproteobacteria bacterium]
MTLTLPRALIVDDEPEIAELIKMTLARMDVTCDTAATLAAAKEKLAQNGYDFCITDLRLGRDNGLDLVTHIQSDHPDTPVAMITAHGNMDAAVTALKAGAFDFVSKPVAISQLRDMVSAALKLRKTAPAGESAKSRELIGDSSIMQKLRKQIVKVARTRTPVLITGESGTGKERVAQLIHQASAQADGPFLPVNCGAIPSELLESEFFGHVKGSFSGATHDRDGLFRAAAGGTLFLDEIADLPLSMQVKLLRAIQERKIRPVGGDQEQEVDIRLLSASHHDLDKRVEEGLFRQDLYYRLNVIKLVVPPLRDRTDDLPALIEHMMGKLVVDQELPIEPVVSDEAVMALQQYSFPGNVRELENIIARASAMCENNHITADDLGLPTTPAESPLATPPVLTDELEDLERQRIEQALIDNRYNKTAAAKQLGITFRALRYRLQKLSME